MPEPKRLSAEGFNKLMAKLLKKYEYNEATFHIEADAIMCQFIEQRGGKVGIEIFRKAEKWYE